MEAASHFGSTFLQLDIGSLIGVEEMMNNSKYSSISVQNLKTSVKKLKMKINFNCQDENKHEANIQINKGMFFTKPGSRFWNGSARVQI